MDKILHPHNQFEGLILTIIHVETIVRREIQPVSRPDSLFSTHFCLPMERRLFCNILFLIIIICESDSLIVDTNSPSSAKDVRDDLKMNKSRLPTLLILSMPTQFHYSKH